VRSKKKNGRKLSGKEVLPRRKRERRKSVISRRPYGIGEKQGLEKGKILERESPRWERGEALQQKCASLTCIGGIVKK